MSFWNVDNLKAAMGGTWVARCAVESVIGLSTDSRTLKAGQAFLAIKGETFDGHAKVHEAAAAGAPLVVVDALGAVGGKLPDGVGVLKVGDTRRALLRLAAAYRKTLERTRVVAVCGSNGKTTTVRMLSAVLARGGESENRWRGTASPRSFNNEIGVPLTILSAMPGDQYLICEIGTNAPGEVATLAEVVQPDIALITSIGREHLERLGSVRGVAREEATVLEHVRPGGAGGAGIVTADSAELREVLPSLGSRPRAMITFGFDDSADVRVVEVRQSLGGVRFTLNDKAEFAMPILGRHNAANAAGVVAAARRLGMGDAEIAAGLAAVKGEAMRLEVVKAGGVCIINDAYNANPDSMRASLETFFEVAAEAKRRFVVLGDMLEMGSYSDEGHREVVESLRDRPVHGAVLVGKAMRGAAGALAGTNIEVTLVDDLDEKRAGEVAGKLRAGDAVLLKGSRRMRLERLLPAMKAPVAMH
ncbi:MAG: UDP-N-acetylmuramoyl-tripeptide--D-alanyl-D-alanine ligase [Phycisphaeraceae bacterium]|nr:UDP-N-acetylmuramoyl-tripeptide--D-alanyl-D-alanine ligase [Phycisphaeraceae bacterium]